MEKLKYGYDSRVFTFLLIFASYFNASDFLSQSGSLQGDYIPMTVLSILALAYYCLPYDLLKYISHDLPLLFSTATGPPITDR